VIHTAEGWRLTPDSPEAEQANRFLERIELRGLSEGSMRTYAYDLLALLRWANAAPMEGMGQEQMLEFIRRHRHRLHPLTINRRLQLLDRYLRFQRKEPLPASAFSTRRRRRRRNLPLMRVAEIMKPPLSHQEVDKLWEQLRTLRDQAIVAVMWTSGLRIAEVLALALCDVDFQSLSLRVQGKGQKQRAVPMPLWVGGLIQLYLQAERPRTECPQLFVVLKGPRRGQPLSYAGARRLFRYYRAKLRMPQAHPHRFRHTFAANMVRHGLNIRQLMRLLGHRWPSTTMRYLYFDDRELREDYERAMRKLPKPPSAL
jgi:site-specific recombinase XerD